MSQCIILFQLLNPSINNAPYIYSLIAEGKLQVSERLQKALKSNDCTTQCRRLLSRESLLIIEGFLMKKLIYTLQRKNMHTSRILISKRRASQSSSTSWSSPSFS
jgi:hypothetical protein